MAWIKRNLFFVISVFVGLLLTGYCAFLLFNSLKENAAVSEEYKSTYDSLDAMLKQSPFPDTEQHSGGQSGQGACAPVSG